MSEGRRYRIPRRPLPLREEQPRRILLQGDGFPKPPSAPLPRSHISFVEQEQRVVNSLRNEMTPRITKKIAKAFNNVRHGTGSKMQKMWHKIELIEQVKELERRRDDKQFQELFWAPLHTGAAPCKRKAFMMVSQQAAGETQQQYADKRAAWRRSFVPEFMVMYEYGHDTAGHPHKCPVAALKLP